MYNTTDIDIKRSWTQKPEQEQPENEFERGSIACRKRLFVTRVAMTLSRFPRVGEYLGLAKEQASCQGAIREVMVVAMAVNGGRLRLPVREALKGLREPLRPA